MELGEFIKERRAEIGMTQVRLAELLGKSASTIRSWERGATAPPDDVHIGLATALGVELSTLQELAGVADLVDGSSEEPRPSDARPAPEGAAIDGDSVLEDAVSDHAESDDVLSDGVLSDASAADDAGPVSENEAVIGEDAGAAADDAVGNVTLIASGMGEVRGENALVVTVRGAAVTLEIAYLDNVFDGMPDSFSPRARYHSEGDTVRIRVVLTRDNQIFDERELTLPLADSDAIAAEVLPAIADMLPHL